MTRPSLSIVIPIYNEEARIGKNLRAIYTYCESQQLDYEIILSNDGTPDRSIEVAKRIAQDYDPSKLRVVGSSQNYGKGHAVRVGMQAATKEVRLFTDADGSTPITELEKFWKPLEQHAFVIGNRKLSGAHILEHQSKLKEWFGRLGNFVIQLLTVRGIDDTQCGFKAFRGDAHRLFDHLTIDRWAFDVELLVLARLYHIPIAQVPVNWKNDERSTVKLLDYPKTLWHVLKIRMNVLSGMYSKTL